MTNTTPTYKSFNDLCKYESDKYNIPVYIDIEMTLIGMLIAGMPEYQQLILDHTNEKMFFDKSLKNLYKIIVAYVKELGLKKLNLTDFKLYSKGLLSDKTIDYITQIDVLYRDFTQSGNAKIWIERLHQEYKRKTEKLCTCYEDYKQLENELEQFQIKQSDITLSGIFDNYSNTYDNKAGKNIKTGYPSIDNLIGGFQGGNLSILAAATGMGKTVTALNLMIKMAERDIKVLFFSLEMNNDELFTRIAAIKTFINSEKIRNRELNDSEWGLLWSFYGSEIFEKLNKNIKLHEKSNLNISKIESIVRKTKADIIICDYLGLITGEKRNNTYEEISDVSRRLKLLAIETDKPIIALHQLNRDSKDRKDKRPKLSDIRDSGKIEQDADFIFFVYRPAYYDTSADKTELQFIIAKSRHSGGAGKIANLTFIGENQIINDKMQGRGKYSNG